MKKKPLPRWLPFALVSSFLVAVGAGIRSGWKVAADQPPGPPEPPVKQAGVLEDWGLGIQVLEPIDQTHLVGFVQVYDLVYSWRNGAWVITTNSTSGGGNKLFPIYDLDKQPYIDQLYSIQEPTVIVRYYWGAQKHWVFFGTNQNY